MNNPEHITLHKPTAGWAPPAIGIALNHDELQWFLGVILETALDRVAACFSEGAAPPPPGCDNQYAAGVYESTGATIAKLYEHITGQSMENEAIFDMVPSLKHILRNPAMASYARGHHMGIALWIREIAAVIINDTPFSKSDG